MQHLTIAAAAATEGRRVVAARRPMWPRPLYQLGSYGPIVAALLFTAGTPAAQSPRPTIDEILGRVELRERQRTDLAEGPGLADPHGLSFTSDGKQLLASDDARALVIGLAGAPTRRLDFGHVVASGRAGAEVIRLEDGIVSVLDVDRSELVARFDPPSARGTPDERVIAVFVSPDGRTLLGTSWGDGMRVSNFRLDLVRGEWSVLDCESHLRAVAWSIDGNRALLATERARMCGRATRRGALAEWNLASGCAELSFGDEQVPDAAAFVAGDRAVLWSDDSALHRADLADPSAPVRHEASVDYLCRLDPILGLSHDDEQLTLWDLRALTPLHHAQLGDADRPVPIRAVAVAPDRRSVAVLSAREVVVFDVVRR